MQRRKNWEFLKKVGNVVPLEIETLGDQGKDDLVRYRMHTERTYRNQTIMKKMAAATFFEGWNTSDQIFRKQTAHRSGTGEWRKLYDEELHD
jgi:hypothetical protein